MFRFNPMLPQPRPISAPVPTMGSANPMAGGSVGGGSLGGQPSVAGPDPFRSLGPSGPGLGPVQGAPTPTPAPAPIASAPAPMGGFGGMPGRGLAR